MDTEILGNIFLYGKKENLREYSYKLENIYKDSSKIINYLAQSTEPDPSYSI
jgi:hypothetical protein